MFKINKSFVIVGIVIIVLINVSCSDSQKQNPEPLALDKNIPSVSITSETFIGGAKSDTLAAVLGQPVAVQTDIEGNIYIADRASLTIKIFDREGNYKRSIGGRGRGPGKFHDINIMEKTPEGDFVILDRGNLRYTTISREGEYIDEYSIDLSNQFYFDDILFVEGKIIGSSISGYNANAENPNEIFSRNIYHVYSRDFKTKHSSFGPVKQLGIKDWFAWLIMNGRSGSSVYIEEKEELLFSPGIYTGKLYSYSQSNEKQWKLADSLIVTPPSNEPYILYDNETQVQKAFDLLLAGSAKISFSGRKSRGRVLSFDAGIFYLPGRKQIVQFYAEWRKEEISLKEGYLLNLNVQVLDLEGNILGSSSIMSTCHNPIARDFDLISRVDSEENFYMIDNSTDEPKVRRFTLDLPE